MRLFNVRRFSDQRGFTLIEILAALAIAGILSALAMPNFLAWLNRNKVQQVAESVQGALQDAQRQAIRLGKSCQVTLRNTDTSPPAGVYNHLRATQASTSTVTPSVTPSPSPTAPLGRCFVAIDPSRVPLLPDGIRMLTNIDPLDPTETSPGIEFSFRGHVSKPSFGVKAITDNLNDSSAFPTIVIYATPDNSGREYPNQQRRCVVVASLLGAIRMGIYDPEEALTDETGNPKTPTASKCKANLEGTRS